MYNFKMLQFSADNLEKHRLPGLPLPLVGPRCGLLHGGQQHDVHSRVRGLPVGHHPGQLERGDVTHSLLVNLTDCIFSENGHNRESDPGFD